MKYIIEHRTSQFSFYIARKGHFLLVHTHPDRLFDAGQVEISDICYTFCLFFLPLLHNETD